MTVLSDGDIVKRLKSKSYHTRIVINPCRIITDVQPCSVDLHLSEDLKKLNGKTYILTEDDTYTLKPDEFILASTKEYIEIPEDLTAFIDGKSSINRVGVIVHKGFVDSGFKGNITLEIKNISNNDLTLKKDMSIAQILFFKLSSPVTRLYGNENLKSKYQNSQGTILSKGGENT